MHHPERGECPLLTLHSSGLRSSRHCFSSLDDQFPTFRNSFLVPSSLAYWYNVFIRHENVSLIWQNLKATLLYSPVRPQCRQRRQSWNSHMYSAESNTLPRNQTAWWRMCLSVMFSILRKIIAVE